MNRLTATQLTTWRQFLTLHRHIVDAIDHDLQRAGRLPLTSYDVLIELYEAPEQRLRMAELARRVVLSRSGLTRLVDRLEVDGLLRRDRSLADRRGAYAGLTESGVRAMRDAWPIYERGILRYFASALSSDEVAALENLLAKIAARPIETDPTL
jgi:DNA-binding MarR family transcriptional regulator